MQFRNGERVETTRQVHGELIGGYGGSRRFDAGTSGTITRANTNMSIVRFGAPANQHWLEGWSIWVNNSELVSIDDQPSDPDAPRPRKLGVKPEGDEHLDPNDPRLAWFWDDVSAYAAKSSYCGVFDTILKELHLPARKQMFTPTVRFNGMNVSASIMARSNTEASELLKKQLDEAVAKEAAKVAAEVES